MTYVGMLYNPSPADEAGPITNRRYLAGLYDLVDLGRQLHREARAVGWHESEVQIALSDGAPCLEKFFTTYFPKAVLILDFFHAAEHLAELARALQRNEPACQQTWTRWCTLLKQQGGQAVLAELDQLDQTGWSAEMQEAWRKETGYLRHNVHRMEYPRYRAKGWRIGSGPIEAACKTVIDARMKGAGMRWKPPATDAIATYIIDAYPATAVANIRRIRYELRFAYSLRSPGRFVMFTVLAERVVTLLAIVSLTFLHDVECDLAQSDHPLMVLAEPSTLALAIIGAGVMAASFRMRRSKRRRLQSVQTKYPQRDAQHVGVQPKRGAA